ncbi:MAG TPA: hypothetical protein VEU96_23130 [Bryobacteraceae bacterium]|nr:hypothetical protein [Bryobacteraceae bacterium]
MFLRKRRRFVWVRHTLLIAAMIILTLPVNAAPASTHRAVLSVAALKELTPEGYKIEKTIDCEPDQGAQREHLVALADADDRQIPTKPVMLLLVAVGKKIVVEDSVTLHSDANRGKFWDGAPNYFGGLTKESVGGGDLFLVRSVLSAGGSGSLHYFDFYRLEKKKLRLVKSFSHGRMEQTYFAVYKNAVYDAKCVCSRGEKHGKAYVYTCYLQVTKYAYDGQAIRPVGSERMREQRGNRYLQDKYWFISVLKALQKNEIFTQAP